MLKIMGTSTCDLLIGSLAGEPEDPVDGICGQVDGSSVPDWICYEAGQSAYGDIFAWFRDLLMWPSIQIPGVHYDAGVGNAILSVFDSEAANISPSESGILAIDWLNGRRTPFADQNLKGAITGLTLGPTTLMVYRALVEAAAFGSRAINERFIQEGIPVNEIIAAGGVARKSPFVMQLNADVLDMETRVSASDQSGAFGAAMRASVAAGIYGDVTAAQDAMGEGIETIYFPIPSRKEIYDNLYRKYLELGSFVEKSFRTCP